MPDLFFVAAANLGRLTVDRLNGPADLVAEIVSKDSVTRDYREKFLEYQEAGIPEYWVIESRSGRQEAAFFALGGNGMYEPLPQRYHRPNPFPGAHWLLDRRKMVLAGPATETVRARRSANRRAPVSYSREWEHCISWRSQIFRQ